MRRARRDAQGTAAQETEGGLTVAIAPQPREDSRESVLVVGIGNELLGDEGLGVHVARALQARKDELPRSVEVIDAGTSLLDLPAVVARFPRVILVDAIHADQEPGTVYRIDDAADLALSGELSPAISLHECSAADMLRMLRIMGIAIPHLSLIGAEPANIHPSLDLSPEVRAAAERIVSMLIGELGAETNV
jgi:hydrogenase maturation protease